MLTADGVPFRMRENAFISVSDPSALHAAAAAILTNLDGKLENAGLDPRIPWLGNRRLRFKFR